MSDTSTPPPPPRPITDLPEEKRGNSRLWMYFVVGMIVLSLIIWSGSRMAEPPVQGGSPANEVPY